MKYTREFLASLDPEVRKIVLTDPDKVSGMHRGDPDPWGCQIQKSSHEAPEEAESGTGQIIEHMKFYVFDCADWKKGFNIKSHLRRVRKIKKQFLLTYIPADMVTERGTVRQR